VSSGFTHPHVVVAVRFGAHRRARSRIVPKK